MPAWSLRRAKCRPPPADRSSTIGGRSIPFESEPTGWWTPDKKSVRWLLVHFTASTDRHYVFRPGAGAEKPQGPPIATASPEGIAINTGPLRVRLSATRPTLFQEVLLNGQAMIEPGQSAFDWTDDEDRPLDCTSWKLTLEESTPRRATVRAEAMMKRADAPTLARLAVRYRFDAGEAHVRLDHTLTWWPKSLEPGAGRIALRIKPALRGAATTRIGLVGDAAQQAVALNSAHSLVAYQDDCEHFAIRQAGRTLREGKHLAGWMAIEQPDGLAIGVALKSMWQLYPKSLAVRQGVLEVGLWPREAGRLSCEERDIMPVPLWFSPIWKGYDWSRNGGFVPLQVNDVLAGRREAFLRALPSQPNILSRLRPEVRERILAYRPGTPRLRRLHRPAWSITSMSCCRSATCSTPRRCRRSRSSPRPKNSWRAARPS